MPPLDPNADAYVPPSLPRSISYQSYLQVPKADSSLTNDVVVPRSYSPSRPPTSAEIDAVIANAIANAPPAPPAAAEPAQESESGLDSVQGILELTLSSYQPVNHSTHDKLPPSICWC